MTNLTDTDQARALARAHERHTRTAEERAADLLSIGRVEATVAREDARSHRALVVLYDAVARLLLGIEHGHVLDPPDAVMLAAAVDLLSILDERGDRRTDA
jgi:hypothetical protein